MRCQTFCDTQTTYATHTTDTMYPQKQVVCESSFRGADMRDCILPWKQRCSRRIATLGSLMSHHQAVAGAFVNVLMLLIEVKLSQKPLRLRNIWTDMKEMPTEQGMLDGARFSQDFILFLTTETLTRFWYANSLFHAHSPAFIRARMQVHQRNPVGAAISEKCDFGVPHRHAQRRAPRLQILCQ